MKIFAQFRKLAKRNVAINEMLYINYSDIFAVLAENGVSWSFDAANTVDLRACSECAIVNTSFGLCDKISSWIGIDHQSFLHAETTCRLIYQMSNKYTTQRLKIDVATSAN